MNNAIYVEISGIIRSRILSGHIPVGQKIPSEYALAEEFSVSRMTARQAVSELVNEGLIERRRGSGAFVTSDKIVRNPTSMVGFYDDMEARGLKPGSVVLTKLKRMPTQLEAKDLAISKVEPIIYIERIRSVDGSKVALQKLTVPISRVGSIDDLDLAKESFYGWLKAKGLPIVSGRQRIESLQDFEVATILGAPEHTPLLKASRISYLASGEAVESLVTYYDGTKYSFEMELKQPQ